MLMRLSIVKLYSVEFVNIYLKNYTLTIPSFWCKRCSDYVYIGTVHHNLICPLCNLQKKH